MAYGLRYQSDFYNIYGKLVSVKIYKEDYSDSVEDDIRIKELEIQFNYKDHETTLIGTGAKIVLVNTEGFTWLDELLTSLEKQFMCIIEYNSVVVFKGFSICDLNEQQFVSKASITLQFTDYIGRIDGYYLTALNDIAEQTTIYEMLSEMIDVIGLHEDLYVNSTLLEENMDAGAVDTLIEQTYIDNNALYEDSVNYENVYDSINKVMKPFLGFFYSYGDKWIYERLEDITRTGDWVRMGAGSSAINAEAISSLKAALNKQAGDFKYVDVSQKIFYNSGLKTLIMNLKDNALDTFIFNDYDPTRMISTTDSIPDPGAIEARKWYYYYELTGLKKGYDFRGIGSYIKWFSPYVLSEGENLGLYSAFVLQNNSSVDEPLELNVNYTMSCLDNVSTFKYVRLRYAIMIDGGLMDGKFLCDFELSDGSVIPNFSNSAFYAFEENFEIDPLSPQRWTVNKSINLTGQFLNSDTGTIYNSIWHQLGNPKTQKFVIMFFPIRYSFTLSLLGFYARTNYLGDVSITVSQGEIPNRYTYYINQDFIKTEEIDLDFFDFDNVNFSNGFMYNDGSSENLIKTTKWISENNTSAISLTDIYAQVVFRNNYRTMHNLGGTIMYDGYLKPFSVLTDDNLKDTEGNNRQFLLLGYTWDLNNGTYDIDTEEYVDEEVTLSGGDLLVAPTITTCSQPVAGSNLYIEWSLVTGATGYSLQRKPNWYTSSGGTSYWAQYWETIYSGPNVLYADHIEEEGTAENEMDVVYRVCAFSNIQNGEYSGESTVKWYSA